MIQTRTIIGEAVMSVMRYHINCPKKYGEQTANRNAIMMCTDEKSQVETSEEDAHAVMSTLEVQSEEKKVEGGVYGDLIEMVKVNAKTMQSLYDTGATKAALRQWLEKPEQLIGKFEWCKFQKGMSAKYPLANVEIEGEYFKSLVELMVVPNLVKDMIITPKQYVRPVKAKKARRSTEK